ncbi:MAG: tetratricopeptide repeat protein [Acidobacteria bacterium]|nr:tetratricopeptide repeat protein [Acidobacteriota bacterium]
MTFDKTKAMRNAEKYLSQGKIRSAISEYEQVIKFDARDFGTINMLGDLYSKNTETTAAIRCYKAVADHYGKQGFAQKAIAVYNKISRLDPQSVEVWRKLGELYKQKGSLNESRTHFQKVADHYEKTGQKIEALAIWKEIALLDPSDTVAYLTLAESYLAENEVDEAIEAYNEVGKRFAAKGEHEEAIAAFQKALSISKADPKALAGFVSSQSVLGRAKESAEKLAELLTEFPHSREIRFLLIDCLIEANEIAEAEKVVIKLVEMEPANYPKFLELAHIYTDSGDVNSASRILSMSSEHMLVGGQAEEFNGLVVTVLAKDPNHLEALRLQARYCSWQRDEDALCRSLTRLAQVAKDADSVDDERYALLQLTMLVPQEAGYAERLREINAEHGFDSSDGENLFDKRFLKNGNAAHPMEYSAPGEAPLVNFDYAAGSNEQGDNGFAFAGAVTEVAEPELSVDETIGVAANDDTRLQKEIDSIRFYIDNGYTELAEKAANELRGEFGERPEIVSLLEEINSVKALTAETPADVTSNPEPQQIDLKTFDPNDFRRELGLEDSAQPDDSDYETHFNTAIAYQEMGLVEEAIKEFQEAVSLVKANDGTRRFFSCANLLGHCFMQQQMPQLALKWYERTLETADLSKEEKQGLWYELAAAYEADGDAERAGQYFEQVYAENVNFRDVSERMKSIAVNH